MSNQFFGQYLLEKGLLSTQQLLIAIKLQKEANPPLGELAIREGFIDKSAASRINSEQQRTDMRFGELAISLQLMTEQQVSLLFHTQKEIKKFFGEIVVEQGFMTQSSLSEQLETHGALKKLSLDHIDSSIKQHVYCEQITQTLDAIIKNFTRIPKIHVQVSQVEPQQPELLPDHVIISQTAQIPDQVKIGWVMDRPLMKQLATNFLGIDASDNEALYIDATSEFLNIILGNDLASNHSGDDQTHLEPPLIELPEDNIQGSYDNGFYLSMSAGQDMFSVFFIYD